MRDENVIFIKPEEGLERELPSVPHQWQLLAYCLKHLQVFLFQILTLP
jgi:hypothetical protein